MSIELTREGAILVVTMNRPDKKNAIDEAHATALSRAVDLLESDDELLVGVLTGAAGVFSSGADLGARIRGERVLTAQGFAGITHRIRTKPVIAAVEGLAYGGGFEMALACDLLVASRGASFALPEVKRAVLPAAGGAYRLGWFLPARIALEMLLTGRPLDATEAHARGLVNHLTEPDLALSRAAQIAREIASLPPLAVRSLLRIATRSRGMSESEAAELSRQEYAFIKTTADYREGPRAFMEKRPPQWTGA